MTVWVISLTSDVLSQSRFRLDLSKGFFACDASFRALTRNSARPPTALASVAAVMVFPTPVALYSSAMVLPFSRIFCRFR